MLAPQRFTMSRALDSAPLAGEPGRTNATPLASHFIHATTVRVEFRTSIAELFAELAVVLHITNTGLVNGLAVAVALLLALHSREAVIALA